MSRIVERIRDEFNDLLSKINNVFCIEHVVKLNFTKPGLFLSVIPNYDPDLQFRFTVSGNVIRLKELFEKVNVNCHAMNINKIGQRERRKMSIKFSIGNTSAISDQFFIYSIRKIHDLFCSSKSPLHTYRNSLFNYFPQKDLTEDLMLHEVDILKDEVEETEIIVEEEDFAGKKYFQNYFPIQQRESMINDESSIFDGNWLKTTQDYNRYERGISQQQQNRRTNNNNNKINSNDNDNIPSFGRILKMDPFRFVDAFPKLLMVGRMVEVYFICSSIPKVKDIEISFSVRNSSKIEKVVLSHEMIDSIERLKERKTEKQKKREEVVVVEEEEEQEETKRESFHFKKKENVPGNHLILKFRVPDFYIFRNENLTLLEDEQYLLSANYHLFDSLISYRKSIVHLSVHFRLLSSLSSYPKQQQSTSTMNLTDDYDTEDGINNRNEDKIREDQDNNSNNNNNNDDGDDEEIRHHKEERQFVSFDSSRYFSYNDVFLYINPVFYRKVYPSVKYHVNAFKVLKVLPSKGNVGDLVGIYISIGCPFLVPSENVMAISFGSSSFETTRSGLLGVYYAQKHNFFQKYSPKDAEFVIVCKVPYQKKKNPIVDLWKKFYKQNNENYEEENERKRKRRRPNTNFNNPQMNIKKERMKELSNRFFVDVSVSIRGCVRIIGTKLNGFEYKQKNPFFNGEEQEQEQEQEQIFDPHHSPMKDDEVEEDIFCDNDNDRPSLLPCSSSPLLLLEPRPPATEQLHQLHQLQQLQQLEDYHQYHQYHPFSSNDYSFGSYFFQNFLLEIGFESTVGCPSFDFMNLNKNRVKRVIRRYLLCKSRSSNTFCPLLDHCGMNILTHLISRKVTFLVKLSMDMCMRNGFNILLHKDNFGNTPLHWAYFYDFIDIKILLTRYLEAVAPAEKAVNFVGMNSKVLMGINKFKYYAFKSWRLRTMRMIQKESFYLGLKRKV